MGKKLETGWRRNLRQIYAKLLLLNFEGIDRSHW